MQCTLLEECYAHMCEEHEASVTTYVLEVMPHAGQPMKECQRGQIMYSHRSTKAQKELPRPGAPDGAGRAKT